MIKAAMLGCGIAALATAALAQETKKPATNATPDQKHPDTSNVSPDHGVLFSAEAVPSSGSVSVEGKPIAYHAVAGTLVVHPEGWDDAAWREKSGNDLGDKKDAKAEASMFYVAYFKNGAPSAGRPITFLFNGGPGSSTVWLHMGAFGPRRVLTATDTHMPAAPYSVVNNAYSLLDATDMVFIDAPGTGFSRIAGKDKEKGFLGVDADAHAFSEFIKGFLSKYDRWNSPKYLFGESYGTPRASVVVNELETGDNIDFNGVIMLSQILNFDLSVDTPQFNPGSDEAYITSLPTFAATAWYHNRLGAARPADLETFLQQAVQFATTDYAQALQKGSELDPARKAQVAEHMSQLIGIPAAYILKSDLRLDGGQFSKELQNASGITTGRLDTRFSGPDIDPLSKEADYDPQSASISSAYVAAFNDYARTTLHYGEDRTFKPGIDVFKDWDFNHKQPGMPFAIRGATNVMPDLAMAMKYNPNLKIMLNGGYYDLATPYYEGWYEMHHMPIPDNLQNNIEYKYYPSGHMVYAAEASLKALHDNVAAFIRRTDNQGG
ncbi:MAG: peptidase S10 [Pseudomonadota bacterium]|nr:peptidase S10 [Pseudomonadota bacterium]